MSENSTESAIPFSFKKVKKKPSRRYRKGSKYDPVVDGFIAQDENLVTVDIEGKDANYIRTQINKRLTARDITTVKVSVVNNKCYLEKI